MPRKTSEETLEEKKTPPSTPSKGRKAKKKGSEAEREVVDSYTFTQSLQYTRDFDPQHPNTLVKRESNLVFQKRSTSTKSLLSQPMEGSQRDSRKTRPTLKQVAESFIRARRLSKSLYFALGDVVERMCIENRQVVTRGSLLGLVGYLTWLNQELDIDYLHEFLLTYPLFMTSIQLLKILNSFYSRCSQAVSQDVYTAGARAFIQVRVLDILEIWIKRHPSDFPAGSQAEEFATQFLQARRGDYEIVSDIISILEEARQMKPLRISFPRDHVPAHPEVAFPGKISPQEFARHLLTVDLNMLRQVPISDFYAYVKDPITESSSELGYLLKWSEKFSLWVARNICLGNSSQERSSMMIYFLKVAQGCKELNNFNGLFQIIKGFMTSPVRRLKKSWDKLPGSWKRVYDVGNSSPSIFSPL